MAPLCPYTFAFTFDILPSFITQIVDPLTSMSTMTAYSEDRTDEFHDIVEVTATVFE